MVDIFLHRMTPRKSRGCFKSELMGFKVKVAPDTGFEPVTK